MLFCNQTSRLTLKDHADKLRKTIKAAKDSGKIFRDVKVSVQTGNRRIRVTIVKFPFDVVSSCKLATYISGPEFRSERYRTPGSENKPEFLSREIWKTMQTIRELSFSQDMEICVDEVLWKENLQKAFRTLGIVPENNVTL